MKRFVIFTFGFKQPTDEIMQAWGTWFKSIGDKMVEMGGPFGPGKEITPTGSKDLPMGVDSLTGYCVVNVETFSEAEAIASACPMITSVRVYETMSEG